MEQMHATYQALKAATEHLYTEIRSKEQELAVSKVRPALNATLKALEDHLGITKARKEALKRKQEEDAPVVEAKTGEPFKITQSPGEITAAATEAANNKA